MTAAMQDKPEADATAISRLFGSALIQGSELCMNTHKELLVNLGTMLESWLQLNRAAVDTSSRMLQRLQECQTLGELFRLQQEWTSDYWHAQWSTAGGAPAAQRTMARSLEPAEAARAEIRVRREPATENAAKRMTAAE